MNALSASEIVTIWEVGQGQNTLERALTILSIAGPHKTRDQWAMLGIGERDAWLFAIRERSFGSKLAGLLDCPACATRLEVEMEAGELCGSPDSEESAGSLTVFADAYQVQFRLPNSQDLDFAARAANEMSIDRHLLQRCIQSARCGAAEVPFEQLPDATCDAITEQISQADPRMEIEIALRCPACGNRWQALFDITSFLWSEICARAHRFLREVHALASAYGWRESDILALTSQRRQIYLEMIGV